MGVGIIVNWQIKCSDESLKIKTKQRACGVCCKPFVSIILKLEIMDKAKITESYINSPKEYEVCAHTFMGGYMDFFIIEKLMFDELGIAKEVCDKYASTWSKKPSEIVKSICVRHNREIIYEKNIHK